MRADSDRTDVIYVSGRYRLGDSLRGNVITFAKLYDMRAKGSEEVGMS